MARKKYDEKLYRVRIPKGSKLTPSKVAPGALSPLVHDKGIKAQAQLFPVRTGGWKRKVLTLAAKTGFAVIAGGVVIVVATMIFGAVADGVAAGATKVVTVVENGTVVVGSAVAFLLVGAVVLGLVRIAVRSQRTAKRARGNHPVGDPHGVAGSSDHPSYRRQPLPEGHGAHRPLSNATETTPIADWYPDPWRLASLRFWDGVTWTHHVHDVQGVTQPGQPGTRPQTVLGDATVGDEPRVSMTSAEWQDYVLAWMKTGAMEQELWKRLSHAQIRDADQATLAAQRAMENLTLEEGQQRAKRVLEMAPNVHDGAAIAEFMQLLLGRAVQARHQPPGINSVDYLHRPGAPLR